MVLSGDYKMSQAQDKVDMGDRRVERKKEALSLVTSVLKPVDYPSLVSHLCPARPLSNIVLTVYTGWDRGLWDLQPGTSGTEARHFS